MEQWSILSNLISYVQYSKNPKNFHIMLIKPVNKNKINVGRRQGEKDRFTSEVGLIDTSERLTEEHLDRYEGVKSEILNTARCDEKSDLSMIYLGKTNMIRDHKMVAEKNSNVRRSVYNR